MRRVAAPLEPPRARVPRDGQPLRLTERRFANAAILDLHGALTGASAGELLEVAIRTRAEAGARLVIVNLANIDAIDGHGVQAMRAMAEWARRRHSELRIAGEWERLASAGESHAERSPRIFPTVDDALWDLRAMLEQRQARLMTDGIRAWLSTLHQRLFRKD